MSKWLSKAKSLKLLQQQKEQWAENKGAGVRELWAQTQTGTSLYLLLSDFGKDFIKRKNEVSLGA